MKIQSLTAFHVPIALKKPIRHASHHRRHNDTLLVRCELDTGHVGWGEGLPRTYVTGESIDSVWRHLDATDFSSLQQDWKQPLDAVAALDEFSLTPVPADRDVVTRECFGNAVRCGLELSILDAVTRSVGVPLSVVIQSLPEARSVLQARDEVNYSSAITSMSPGKQWLSAWKMKLFGFCQIKVKVGADGIDDLACLRRIRRVVGPQVDLRLDANEAWDCRDVIQKVAPLMAFGPTSLEQPVPHAQVTGLAEVRSALEIPVMLDESLCSRADADRAITDQTCDLFNLRLSKCGGLISCVRLAALANRHGLGYQLGCQVGETGILSAAGRHFACNIRDIRYLEGSYDRFLVRDSLIEEDLTFARRGRAARLTGPGLGVSVRESRVREIAYRSQSLL